MQEGNYTVKLIKGKETYTTTIKLVPDPRTKSTAADRALQHKTVIQLYDMLGQLTYIVDATVDLRDQARQRAAGASDAQLKAQLQKFADNLEEFRSTLVSVKEGGMITGETEAARKPGRTLRRRQRFLRTSDAVANRDALTSSRSSSTTPPRSSSR